MIVLLAMLATTTTAEGGQRVARMAALYEQICLKTFPNNEAIDRLMGFLGARQLSEADVKVTFKSDPGRAWELKDRSATVWLELPPYHACSVRWNVPEIGDLQPYRIIADRYEMDGGFSAMSPYDSDNGDIHAHAIGERRILEDGSIESLMFFDQHITNEARRAAGETGFSVRLVHQIATPEAH